LRFDGRDDPTFCGASAFRGVCANRRKKEVFADFREKKRRESSETREKSAAASTLRNVSVDNEY